MLHGIYVKEEESDNYWHPRTGKMEELKEIKLFSSELALDITNFHNDCVFVTVE